MDRIHYSICRSRSLKECCINIIMYVDIRNWYNNTYVTLFILTRSKAKVVYQIYIKIFHFEGRDYKPTNTLKCKKKKENKYTGVEENVPRLSSANSPSMPCKLQENFTLFIIQIYLMRSPNSFATNPSNCIILIKLILYMNGHRKNEYEMNPSSVTV